MKFSPSPTLLKLIGAGILVLSSAPIAPAQTEEQATEATPRQAIEDGLVLVQKAARNYPNKRDCFSCHHQTLPMLAMVTARGKGFIIDEELLEDQAEFTREFYHDRIERVREGEGVGGRGMTAGYALWALDLADHPSDETTEALITYLLKNQKKEGHWPRQSLRPPLEETDVTATYLASYYMDRYTGKDAPEERKIAVAKSVATAKKWIRSSTPGSQESLNFQLLAATRFGNPPDMRKQLREAILKRQRKDGGWAQVEKGMESDAYATGQTVFMLHTNRSEASTDNDRKENTAIQRGLAFLMKTRKKDGSWHVKSRSKPIQRMFDNGDPHGKDQFISTPATAWAVAALAATLEKKDPGENKVGDAVQKAAVPYRSADLPSLFHFADGSPVLTPKRWMARRAEIAEQWQDTYLGRFPEVPPQLLDATILDQEMRQDGVGVHKIRLTFDTPKKASFEIRVLIPPAAKREHPKSHGNGLILTQPRNYQIAWGEAAVRRGYFVCYYPGVDYNHRENDFPGYEKAWRTFKEEYPESTWHSSLAIQAWLASRALDYLLGDQCDWRIDPEKIGIIGHSRYGKQSLYAAAFDERIKAVVSRSAGSPAAAGYRFTGRDTFMETVRDAPAEWALPGLKDYFGREHELPVESNGLLALIAPRACLIHTAHNDGSDPTFAVERTYLNAKHVYHFLGHPDQLALLYRPGNHNPITAEHVKSNIDWFDWAFERGAVERTEFPETLIHDFDWPAWKRVQSTKSLIPPGKEAPVKDRILWSLGNPPADFTRPDKTALTILKEEDYGVAKWSRDRWKPQGITRLPVSFGHNVQGNLMFPEKHEGPLPVVIWLHPFNYSHGSNEGYGVEGTTIYYRLAQAGYAVLTFDQCGFGDRLLEGRDFYTKHPEWSKLGRMVYDVRGALDFIHGGPGIVAKDKMPQLDREHAVLLGYSLGAMVALHAGALDERISAVASFCGFTPMRTDTDHKPTGGIRRWWEWHGLEPKLGLFHGKEAGLPYDYEDLITAISRKKPCLVYSAKRDRHVNAEDVAASISSVEAASTKLTFIHADDVNRFQSEQHKVLLDWLKDVRP